MEPQDLAGRELQAIKKRLCYISSTVCAFCLVCLATTLALFLSRQTYQLQPQGNSLEYTGGRTAPAPLKCNCSEYPCGSTTYAILKWYAIEKNSPIVMWKEESLTKGMKLQDGNLTIPINGLYFINCRLHYCINECLSTNQDLYTRLKVNETIKYEVLNTVLQTNNENCKIYKDQHISLHIHLNASDKLSIFTSSPEWLNDESLTDSIVFEVFKV
ncbi:tumor necrosis factor ligand superfamily member 8 [Anomaloglossus baeobatrachus]